MLCMLTWICHNSCWWSSVVSLIYRLLLIIDDNRDFTAVFSTWTGFHSRPGFVWFQMLAQLVSVLKQLMTHMNCAPAIPPPLQIRLVTHDLQYLVKYLEHSWYRFIVGFYFKNWQILLLRWSWLVGRRPQWPPHQSLAAASTWWSSLHLLCVKSWLLWTPRCMAMTSSKPCSLCIYWWESEYQNYMVCHGATGLLEDTLLEINYCTL